MPVQAVVCDGGQVPSLYHAAAIRPELRKALFVRVPLHAMRRGLGRAGTHQFARPAPFAARPVAAGLLNERQAE